jgi:hypothetical protein
MVALAGIPFARFSLAHHNFICVPIPIGIYALMICVLVLVELPLLLVFFPGVLDGRTATKEYDRE